MAAVNTRVEVRATVGAGVQAPDLLTPQQPHRMSAPKAREPEVRHNGCLDKRSMHWEPLQRLNVAVAAVVLVAGLACGGNVPPTNYYVLNLSAPVPAANALRHTAVLMPIRAGRIIRQGRIVYRESPQQVGYYEYHRWAEDPHETVRRSLVRHLRGRGTFSAAVPFDGRTKSDFILRGELTRLEEVDYGGSVRAEVELFLELVDALTASVVWSASASESETVPASEVRSVVERMSVATDRAISDLAGQLDAYLRTLE